MYQHFECLLGKKKFSFVTEIIKKRQNYFYQTKQKLFFLNLMKISEHHLIKEQIRGSQRVTRDASEPVPDSVHEEGLDQTCKVVPEWERGVMKKRKPTKFCHIYVLQSAGVYSHLLSLHLNRPPSDQSNVKDVQNQTEVQFQTPNQKPLTLSTSSRVNPSTLPMSLSTSARLAFGVWK